MRKLITDLADGYLAHGHLEANGDWKFPEEINASTEESKGVLTARSRGNVALMQILWEAYRWTGDDRYLRPLHSELADGTSLAELSELNANVIDILHQRATWGAPLQAAVEQGRGRGGDFGQFIAWQMSGDTRHLEKIYGDEIITANNRMYMVTEGHWWSDRVELFTDELQRTRLGGMALRRNQFVPGHVVSWRFADPDGAQKIGILVPGALPNEFKVIAYNLDSEPVAATMTGWGVEAGVWKVTQSVEGAPVGDVRHLEFEKSQGIEFTFAPHVTTELNLELETPGQDPWDRPDVGIGLADVHVEKGSIRVTVHSLGSVAAPPSALTLVDASGHVAASTKVPAIGAPLDLLPRTAQAILRFGAGVRTTGAHIRIELANGAGEITQLNNEVVLQ